MGFKVGVFFSLLRIFCLVLFFIWELVFFFFWSMWAACLLARTIKILTICFFLSLQVTKNKTWKDIAGLLGIGASSSAAYTLRKHYTKNLLAYECHFDRGGIDPQPIINQVEAQSKKKGNKVISVPSPGKLTFFFAILSGRNSNVFSIRLFKFARLISSNGWWW